MSDQSTGGTLSNMELNEILDNLKKLEDLASEFKGTKDARTINRLVSPYLRKASGRYYSIYWKFSLRNVDTEFCDFVEARDSSLISTLNNDFEVDNSYPKIDFIHLIATIEGYIDRTGIGIPVPQSYFGWAGDLASEAPNLKTRLKDKNVEETLENAKKYSKLSGKAKIVDIVTDIDAALISDITLNSNTRFSKAIEDYYNDHYSERYKLFRDTFGESEEFKEEVKKTLLGNWDPRVLALHQLGDGPVDGIYYEAMAYRFTYFVDEQID